MCGACGILQNGRDWIDDFNAGDEAQSALLAERRRRVQLVNQLLKGSALKLHDHGRFLVLSSLTGKSVVVTSLAHVWKEADAIGRRKIDPLQLPLPNIKT